MKTRSIKVWLLGLMLVLPMAQADVNQIFDSVKGGKTTLAKQMEKGKWTVVMIWSNTCHVCNEEAAAYVKFHGSQKNAKVVGISVDGSVAEAKKFVKRHKVPFVNLVGSATEVGLLYLSESGESFRYTPSFMVYDDKGKLRAVQGGAVPVDVIKKFITNPDA